MGANFNKVLLIASYRAAMGRVFKSQLLKKFTVSRVV